MATITPPHTRPAAAADSGAPTTSLTTLPAVARRRTPARREVVDGHVLVTRPELARLTGEREHTLYKWFAARKDNGHPDGTEIDGVLYVDLERWQHWRAEHSGDRRVINGRVLLSRPELARRTGEPTSNLARWWAQRAHNGHPDGVQIGRKLYHDEQQWFAWYDRFQQQLKAGLTTVDRSGDPDELVGTAEASRVLGYTSSSTIPKYRERGQFVEPDQLDTTSGGRERPLWRRRTLWEFADARTGRPLRRPAD